MAPGDSGAAPSTAHASAHAPDGAVHPLAAAALLLLEANRQGALALAEGGGGRQATVVGRRPARPPTSRAARASWTGPPGTSSLASMTCVFQCTCRLDLAVKLFMHPGNSHLNGLSLVCRCFFFIFKRLK